MGSSVLLHVLAIMLLAIFGNRIVSPIMKHGPTVLIFIPPPPETQEPVPIHKPIIAHRIFAPPKREVTALKVPEPVIRPPEIAVIRTEQPPVRLPAPAPLHKEPPAETARFDSRTPAAEPPKASVSVQTGGFAANAAPAEQARREPATSVGVFGSTPSKLGSPSAALHMPVGNSGFGPGSVPAPGPVDHRTTAQVAGFGAAQLAASASPARAMVARSGFGNAEAAANAAPARTAGAQAGAFGDVRAAAPRPAPKPDEDARGPAQVAIEILAKPKPVYTDEARKLRIEGEVILEVNFTAGDEVQVLRVVRGLGHGLDEAAVTAARAIRYRPAQRDGRPVDSTGTIRIQFELAY